MTIVAQKRSDDFSLIIGSYDFTILCCSVTFVDTKVLLFCDICKF